MKTHILNLNKSPYENGKASGENFKAVLDPAFIKKTEIINHDKSLMEKCSFLLGRLRDEFPVYYEETKGKADGLGLELINYFSSLCPELMGTYQDSCTSIITRKENGNFVLCHNEDDVYIKGNLCFSKISYGNESCFITNDMYNMPFGNGVSLNSHGIFKSINFCYDENINTDNLPRYFAQRHISEAENISDFISRCTQIDTASGFHAIAIDINKNIAVSVEVYSDGIDVEYINDVYIHTNHFIHGKHAINPKASPSGNSIFRLHKATELLKTAERTGDSLKKILSHESPDNNWEKSIFQNETAPERTLFQVTVNTDGDILISTDIYTTNERIVTDRKGNIRICQQKSEK
ncbi:MAG: hypothetical protein E7218_06765 [Anaerofustis stercorihominis]|nr:hypothetical protein [Anaerofustis stercorihominis]